MILSDDINNYIERSVLCWLATGSADNVPNVSPKEIFATYGSDSVIIANIASPQSLKNIKSNHRVCLSFIDVLIQKGYQLKGTAVIIDASNPEYEAMKEILDKMTEGKFPYNSIFKLSIGSSKAIIAPRYILYPQTTEEEQIESARKMYNL